MSPSYYDYSCPSVHDTVRRVIQEARVANPRAPASLLRLHFHDCFVNGCDGSVLLDNAGAMQSEKNAPPNNGSARGFDVVDTIKAALENACPGVVSCADILALAAEISVELSGGPSWNVVLGRRDGTTANFDGASELPGPRDAVGLLRQKFSDLGLDDTDFVALQGAHTIGRAQCRLLRQCCPASEPESTTLRNLDPPTPDAFDNSFYANIVRNRGLLQSDQGMLSAPGGAAATTAPIVVRFAGSQDDFFQSFATAMIKMGNIGSLTGSLGEIRRNCRVVNRG
ncbi:peroxidase 54-like [Oryza brachyantha]|uniref:peroxidase 54-like n=1 Tax=Oryza brachyantha TaxID=4533 RepID=UPI001ADD4401|nr:peroxidase 54-like [Oryza brachyantha]